MKQFVKYFSLAAGIAALLVAAAPMADAAWTAFTQPGARSTVLNGKSGHFEIIDNFIYALGGDGAIYKYNRDIYNLPSGGSWESVGTSGGGVDVFKKGTDGKWYILGGNGAVYRWDSSWTQITKDGARSSDNFGKSGHFDIVDGFIYALGGDGAVYKWSIGITNPIDLTNGTWSKATGDGGTDVFKKTSDEAYYILGQNGAIYRWKDTGTWTQITRDGARSSNNSGGKSGHFEIVDNYIYALGGDGAIYKWSKSITETPDPNGGSWGSALTSAGGTDVFKKGPLTDKPWYILGQNGAVYYESVGVSTYSLTLTKSGTGSGIVTSGNGLVDCPSTCAGGTTYSISSGTSITLTATADSGSTFAGWSGDCSGTGTCSLTMSAAKSVTATFNITSGDTSAPVITSLSPASATVGSLVTIWGEGFTASNNTVNFGDMAIANLTSPGLTITFSVPSVTAGTYNVSVTNSNGTSNTQTFTVTTLGATGGLIVTLTPTPTSVNPNETITVTWTVNSGTPQVNDWIGLFQSGAGNTAYISSQYNATGATTGTLAFSAPAAPGSYQFRYLPRNSYVDVGRSAAVVVQGDITTAPALTFTVSPKTISAGQSYTLTWSTTNTTSCTFGRGGTVTHNGVSKQWSSISDLSGTAIATSIATTGYDISCTGAGGTVTKSVDIVVTPTVSIEQCDIAAAAAKIAEASRKVSSCIAGVSADCALASALLLEATTLLSSCGTVSPAGVPPPGSQLYDGLAVKTNAALYVRSSPEISSTNKLNANRPLPVGATGIIDCSSPENLAAGVTPPDSTNCGVLANGFIWWYVKWNLYDDGWSAEQAPGFTGLIIPAIGGSAGGTTPPPPPPSGSGSVTLTMDPDGPNGPAHENGTGASHIDSVAQAGTVSSNTNNETLRRRLAQISAGVAEVTKGIEQLLKNLGQEQ